MHMEKALPNEKGHAGGHIRASQPTKCAGLVSSDFYPHIMLFQRLLNEPHLWQGHYEQKWQHSGDHNS